MSSPKRARDEDDAGEQGVFLKKICQGLGIDEVESAIHGVLKQDEDSSQVFREDEDFVQDELLSGVMRSLEEEIGFSSGSSTPSSTKNSEEDSSKQTSLDRSFSYLFEASDDELGIAGTETPSTPALSEADFSVPANGEETDFFDFSENFIDGELLKRALVDMGTFGEDSCGENRDDSSQQQQLPLLAL